MNQYERMIALYLEAHVGTSDRTPAEMAYDLTNRIAALNLHAPEDPPAFACPDCGFTFHGYEPSTCPNHPQTYLVLCQEG